MMTVLRSDLRDDEGKLNMHFILDGITGAMGKEENMCNVHDIYYYVCVLMTMVFVE